VAVVGPSRGGKTRLINYLAGRRVNPTPEGGRVTTTVHTDSHKLTVTELRGLLGLGDGKVRWRRRRSGEGARPTSRIRLDWVCRGWRRHCAGWRAAWMRWWWLWMDAAAARAPSPWPAPTS
jgi:hypothetical protein